MVNISDFFGKNKKSVRSSTSRPIGQAGASKPEVIDLDNESDQESNDKTPKKAPSSKVIDISETPEAEKKFPLPAKRKASSSVVKPPSSKKQKPPSKVSDSPSNITAQDILCLLYTSRCV